MSPAEKWQLHNARLSRALAQSLTPLAALSAIVALRHPNPRLGIHQAGELNRSQKAALNALLGANSAEDLIAFIVSETESCTGVWAQENKYGND